MVTQTFPHNDTPSSVRDPIADNLVSSSLHSIPRLACYRQLRYHELAEVIKSYNNDKHKDLLQDVVDDLFGEVHDRFHQKDQYHLSSVLDLTIKDYWDNYRIDNSLYNLLSYSEIGSIEFLESVFRHLISNPVELSIGFDVYKAFLLQPKVSLEMIEALTAWAIPAGEAYLSAYDKVSEGVYTLLPVIFEHPLFTKDRLLGYCGHVNPKIREAAVKAPSCPDEGKVIVALMGNTCLSQ